MAGSVRGVGVPQQGQPRNSIPGSNASQVGSRALENQDRKVSYSKKEIKTITIPLDNTTTNQEYKYPGSFLQFAASTNTTDKIYIRFDNPGNDAYPMLPGSSISGVPFDRLYISWGGVAAAVAELVVINDTPDDRINVF